MTGGWKKLSVPEKYKTERDCAAYINWSSVVSPDGFLDYNSMYMSKNYMNAVWSWDHCFNALSSINIDTKFAFDQFMTIFDKQDEYGAIPDLINTRSLLFTYCKPPIHGWILNMIMEKAENLDNFQLKRIYEPLVKWTNWWFEYRDTSGNKIPEYHHGNDSGWDNSTVFKDTGFIESPDLSAFMVLQMECLSNISKKLGYIDDSFNWDKRANEHLKLMLDYFVRENKFVAKNALTNEVIECESLLLYIPLVLGKRLPEAVRKSMISDLKNKFLTDYGLASEPVNSRYFKEDGYWRGAIWAAPTMIITDGLFSCGEYSFAKDIIIKFADMCQKNGFAENFSALSGKGLRDKAYTWTASIFLILTNKLN